jgi:hypothetical protein
VGDKSPTFKNITELARDIIHTKAISGTCHVAKICQIMMVT